MSARLPPSITLMPFVLALGIVLLLASCTRVEETSTAEPTLVEATVAPTPTLVPPTATPVPPIPTPVPPTATPVPPTPTPTPTPEELSLERIAEFSWYSNDRLSLSDRFALTGNLSDMAVNYPALFEEITSKDMILLLGQRPALYTRRDEIAGAVEITAHLNRIAAVDEASVSTLLRMTFLDIATVEGGKALAFLADLAEVAEGDFVTFVNSPAFPQDIALDELLDDANRNDLSDRIEELLHPFLQLTAPDLAERIEDQVPPVEYEGSTLLNGSRLAIFYPETYEAFSDNLESARYEIGIPDGLVDLAVLDSSIAVRVAAMPLATNPLREFLELWEYLNTAITFNAEGVMVILDSLEEQEKTASEHIPTLLIELVSLYDNESYELMKSLLWVEDGVSGTKFELTQIQIDIAFDTGEDEWIRILTGQIIHEERGTLMIDLLQRDWMRDMNFGWIERQILWQFAFYLDDKEIAVLLDMQFLETIEGDDRFTLLRLGGMEPSQRQLAYPFQDVIEHSLIGGDITDSNQCRLERVIEELRPGSSPIPPSSGVGEPC